MGLTFFFYGTLLDRPGNPVAAALHQRLGPGRAGSLPGALYAIPDAAGWYPALVPDGPGRVRGQIHAAGPAFSAADLALMDRYEGFDPANLAESDYVRRLVPVTCDGPGESDRADAPAFVYCYNRPLPTAAMAIPSGDFLAWLRETGVRAYGSPA